ncbi:putative membrane protein [Hamadaea flava]|uniref:DUF1345 domain-containing protein n=1 Tax=Hamadaea flava TaxID=1742688 RepID=A0ABV8LKN2_9ACTN|nr:DUF1345 domain-containing protein [Hamadaea flava]MCP2324996.1 putative membrane protein [Hamadaea flava]
MVDVLPAWLRPTRGEHRTPAAVAVLVMIGLQLKVSHALHIQPGWLVPAVEGVLLLVLLSTNPGRVNRETRWLRLSGLTLVAAASVLNAYAAARLVVDIATKHAEVNGLTPAVLLLTGAAVWLSNVIVFALWYWELDSGGPAARANARKDRPDFLFPQMTARDLAKPDWEPGFVDYLYVSFTNATAFSPTDTMPMTKWAKLTMMFESAVSVVVVGLVVARAINIL